MTTAAGSICRTACVHAALGANSSLRYTHRTTRECHYRARPCSVGEDDIKVLECGPSVYENASHRCLVKYYTHVVTLFPQGTPDSGPDPNACRRICRRARSDPRRHAHDAAWKFSSSSHRAFDAVWNRLNPLEEPPPGTPGLAIGLPGTPAGMRLPLCRRRGPAPGPWPASMSPAIRSQGPRQPCFFLPSS